MMNGKSCAFAHQRQSDPKVAERYDSYKDILKQGMAKKLSTSSRPVVQPNAGKQNALIARIQGQIQNCEQYEDELT